MVQVRLGDAKFCPLRAPVFTCVEMFLHPEPSLLPTAEEDVAFDPTSPHQRPRAWVIPPAMYVHVRHDCFVLQAPKPAHFSCWRNPVSWEEMGGGRLASSSDSSLLLDLNSFVLMHT